MNGEDSESGIKFVVSEDYYPELLAEVGIAFQDGKRFYFDKMGINFSEVKYFYIGEFD